MARRPFRFRQNCPLALIRDDSILAVAELPLRSSPISRAYDHPVEPILRQIVWSRGGTDNSDAYAAAFDSDRG